MTKEFFRRFPFLVILVFTLINGGCDPCLVGNLCNDETPPEQQVPYYECIGDTGCNGDMLNCDLVVYHPDDFVILGNCMGIKGSFSIKGKMIDSLAEMPPITNITGSLIIEATKLQTLDGLESLSSIGGLILKNNYQLVDIGALDNTVCIVGADSPCTGVSLALNSSLKTFEALRFPMGLESFRAERNEMLQEISGLSGLKHLGSLKLDDHPNLTSLKGLEKLESVGSLIINGAWNLTSLEQLDSLKVVEDNLGIGNCDSLSDLNGLSNVVEVGSENNSTLSIGLNDLLENLDGLHGITSMKGCLSIEFNKILPTCEAAELVDYLTQNANWTPDHCLIEGNLTDECSE